MKKAIVTVSYGTTSTEAMQRSVQAVENDLAHAFPEYDVYRALTGDRIRQALAAQGIPADSPEEILDRLAAEEYSSVLIQPTHIINGSEYDRIVHAVQSRRHRFSTIAVSTPLLHSRTDMEVVCRFLEAQYGNTADAVIVMGHGSDHPANRMYADFADTAHTLGMHRLFIATLEAHPQLEDLFPALKASHCRSVTLVPLLFTAGTHACRDMAGEQPGSWKSRLQAEGFQVSPIVSGLGEHAAIRRLYVQHLQNLMYSTAE